jgi:hypothetical protein
MTGNRISRTVLPLAAVATLCAVGFGQKINMDIGTFNAQPSVAYGAAPAQAGTWNHLTSGAAMALVNTAGAATTASVSSNGVNWAFGFNNTGTSGDDELLLDAGHDGASNYNFTGLQNGEYDVYTYAWAPDNRTGYKTNVSVTGSPDPQQVVGGAWTGTHAQGVTYAKHHVTVSAGTIDVICTVNTSFATVNGIQIVPIAGAPIIYCTAKVNSLGCTPSIGAVGTPSATSGSGFSVTCTQVINNKSGLLFYGNTGQAATPFQGGTLCVKTPIKRTPAQGSGGNPPPNDCSGNYSIDMNTFAVSGPPAAPFLTVVGTVVNCQWWGRDPGFAAPNNTMLSNGVEYVVGP